MNENDKDIEDEIINTISGKINFRKRRTKQIFRLFIKSMAFVSIAAISGGIAGSYMSGKKNATYIYPGAYYSAIGSERSVTNSSDNTLPKSDITKVVSKVSPSIVGIQFNSKSENGVQEKKVGSGVIFKQDGYIITEYNTIKGNGSITVHLPNYDTQLPAQIIGYNRDTDIAVLKIDVKNLPTIKFADTSKVSVGDIAIAVGSEGAVTAGIISTTNNSIDIVSPDTKETISYSVFQTDASINQGNDGGVLCDITGDVMGINHIKLGEFDSISDGLGVALSSSSVTKVIDSIMHVGPTSRPQLGIQAATLSVKDKSLKGVYVKDVIPGSGAETAGVKPTDVITTLDNIKVTTVKELDTIVSKHKSGDKITCVIWRNGKTINTDIVLTEGKGDNS